MKKTTCLLAASALAATALNAQVYVGSDYLHEMEENESGFSIKAGYAFAASDHYASDAKHNIELEAAFFSADESAAGVNASGDLDTVMLNYKYTSDFFSDDLLMYFWVGAGAGVAMADIDVSGFGSDDDSSFAYQFLIGLGYELTEELDVEFGYRRLGVDDLEFFGVDAGSFDYDVLQVGLKFSF